MAQVTITLTDTPTGCVAIHTDYRPALGAPCTPAQSAALDVIRTTRRTWGCEPTAANAASKPPLLAEVDIDAVHRSRDRVITPMLGDMAARPPSCSSPAPSPWSSP